MELQPHQSRACAEYVTLHDNVTKLGAFMNTAAFQQLSFIEQELLREQLTHMIRYQHTLRMRLSLWGVEQGQTGNGMVLMVNSTHVVMKGASSGT
jgi:hypothetical protein